MKTLNIDLAEKPGIGGPISVEMNEPYYPSLHVSGSKELGVPDSGVMLIRYRKVSSSESKDRDGKERYDCTLEVQKIIAVNATKDEPKKEPDEMDLKSDDALDRIAAQLEGEGE